MIEHQRGGGRRRAWFGRMAVAGAALAAVAGGLPLPASAATTTPSSGAAGFDVSYPQCSITSYSGLGAGFAMVGVTHGRPFTANSCAGTELSVAQTYVASGPVGAYFNTGYAGAYAKSIDQTTCGSNVSQAGASGSRHDVSAEEQAWAIGCSEALYAENQVASLGVTPASWWADIETGNSWSTNTTLNYYTVKGMFWQLATTGLPIGAYSYTSAWDKIMGSWATAALSTSATIADWESVGATCSSPGFSGGPVWLVQAGTTTVNGVAVDNDTWC